LKTKIYLFDSNGNNYVYSGYTGLVLEYSPRIKDFLENQSDDAELEELLLNDVSQKMNIRGFEDKPFIRSLTVFITNLCNLDCSYCYNKVNNVNDAQRMDFSLFKRTIDYVLENFQHDNYITISFFGGEPLLNFDFIQESVTYLREIEDHRLVKFRFALTTNGTVLNDEITKFLVSNDFKIMISIDGDRETHNQQRKFLNSSGSFDEVINNSKILSRYINLTARVTIVDLNTDLVRLYESLANEGFKEVNFELISTDKLHGKESYCQLSVRITDLADYVLKMLNTKQLINICNFNNKLSNIHNGNVSIFPCVAGIKSYAISVNGEIYLCHRFNNVNRYKWGDTKYGINKEKRLDFLQGHIVHKRNNSNCGNCWASILCGGDCYHTSYMENQDAYKTSKIHCFFNKELIKNSLRIYASLPEETKIIFENRN
jgi:uncharacterized protein